MWAEKRRQGLQRGTGTLLRVMDMFIVFILVKVSQVYTYVTTHQIVYFKFVQFIIHQLYINKTENKQTNKK